MGLYAGIGCGGSFCEVGLQDGVMSHWLKDVKSTLR